MAIAPVSLADQLRRAGYVVFEASSADEALDLLHCNGVQLVLSDIRMPGMELNSLARFAHNAPKLRSCWHPANRSLPRLGATMMASFRSRMLPAA